MKQTVPLLVYILSIVSLIVIFILIMNSRTAQRDEKIVQLQDSVNIYKAQFTGAMTSADSAITLLDLFSFQGNSAIRETLYIHDTHAQIRQGIYNLDAGSSIGLLSKNLHGD